MEITYDGTDYHPIERRKTEPLVELGPRQIAWLSAKFPGITRNRVVRLADHERAAALYRIAQCVEEARERMEATA